MEDCKKSLKNAEKNKKLEKNNRKCKTIAKKLGEAKYINVKKCFENNYPKTRYKITSKGIRLFEKFFSDIQILKDN